MYHAQPAFLDFAPVLVDNAGLITLEFVTHVQQTVLSVPLHHPDFSAKDVKIHLELVIMFVFLVLMKILIVCYAHKMFKNVVHVIWAMDLIIKEALLSVLFVKVFANNVLQTFQYVLIVNLGNF